MVQCANTVTLLVGLCALAVTVRAELSAIVYGNTALAGAPVLNTIVAELADVLHLLEPWQSVVVEGQVTAKEWAVFSVDTDSGFVRLRVDDHLLQASSRRCYRDSTWCTGPKLLGGQISCETWPARTTGRVH